MPGLTSKTLSHWISKGLNGVRAITQNAYPIELGQQGAWVVGLTLSASVAMGVQNVIEDEAFLLFLADTVLDEEDGDTLTDPLHMIEQAQDFDAPSLAETTKGATEDTSNVITEEAE